MDFKNLPEINFLKETVEEILDKAQKILEAELGRKISRADPLMLLLKSLVAIIYQLLNLINDAAKQNLLAYARGENLEHLGILVGVQRLQASFATTTCKVTLSDALNKAVTIKKGTRVHAGDDVYFALDDDLIFLAGETELVAKFTCIYTGEIGNLYKVGHLKVIVDPQPFLQSIENITVSDGGADIESDDRYRERIRIAPEMFSTAGPTGAYEFFTKSASALITDVAVTSDNPGEVDIFFLQSNSETPTQEVIDKVYEVLETRTTRPLTDLVIVKTPEVQFFDIDLKFFISREDSAAASTIQRKVQVAVEDFILWQRSKLGRDLNDSKLIEMIRNAGAKRVEITSPTFTVIEKNSIALCQNCNVEFAGLEDN